MIRTRVFELAKEAGYETDSDLARAMGISKTHISNVKAGVRQPGTAFVKGAFRAYPGKTFEQLFEVVPDDASEPADVA